MDRVTTSPGAYYGPVCLRSYLLPDQTESVLSVENIMPSRPNTRLSSQDAPCPPKALLSLRGQYHAP